MTSIVRSRTVVPRVSAFIGHALLLTLAAFPAPLAAQDGTPRLTVDRYMDWERVSDPQVSPDGSQVVYSSSWVDKLEDEWESSLWIINADGSKKRFLIDGSSPRWSPDGTRILFTAPRRTRRHPTPRPLDGRRGLGHPNHTRSRHTDERRVVARRQDGLVHHVHARRTPERLVDRPSRGTRRCGLDRDAPHRREHALPGRPRRLHRSRLCPPLRGPGRWRHPPGSLPTANGTSAPATSESTGGVGYDWTPDGSTIVFDGLMKEDWDMRYFESAINAVDVATGETREVTSTMGLWTSPSVSPDGSTIAFTGHEWSPQTYHVGEIHTIGIDGTGMSMLTPNLDRDVGGLMWDPDGSRFYFSVQDRGSSNVYSATTDGDLQQLSEGVQMLSLTSMANGTGVGVRSAPQDPGDVVRFDLSAGATPTQLTRVNEDVLEGVALGDIEEIWYESTEGAQVQGWVIKPPGFDPSQRYPLILEIHGGPHGMYNVGFNWMFQNFAANDFVVLYTNPRGSTGYGTDFGNAIDDSYPGERDLADLLYGVDEVVGRGYIDTDRMYVGGCSGGGVLSSWVIGHDNRFAAAAVRCPVVNWMSFAGTGDVALWAYRRFRELPWDNPDKWLHHSSLMYVDNVTTPTLLLTGELDLRTPMTQSEEFFQALKMVGVPTAIIRFNEEYHGTGRKPSNFIRTQLYMRKWYDRWVGNRPVS